MEGDAARLVFGRRAVQARAAGAAAGAVGTEPFRGDAGAGGAGARGRDHRGGAETDAMEGNRLVPTGQKRCREDGPGGAAAAGNDADDRTDRRPAADGQPEERCSQTSRLEE